MPAVDQAPPAFPLDKWLDAWTVGVRAFFVFPPDEVRRLLKIREAVLYTAPEQLKIRASQAWEVYTDGLDDTPMARAAVALTYILVAGGRP